MTPLDTQKARASIKKGVRTFFESRAYLEVETPIAVIMPGTEAHLDYFKTHWQTHDQSEQPLWLRSSPEVHMKQLISPDAPKIFQIASCFRNGGELARWHHPEFTMVEWYETDISVDAFIQQTAELLSETLDQLTNDNFGTDDSLTLLKFQTFSVAEAFNIFANIDFADEDPDLAAQAKSAGIVSVNKSDDFETAFFKIMLEKVEPAFEKIQAVVLTDYPPSQSALATVVNGTAKRFEFFVKGIELSNGFLELTDPRENQSRIDQCNQQRSENSKPITPIDSNFLTSLEVGLPPCCGNALGLDRWLAICLGHQSLDKVTPFRTAQPYFDRPDL